VKKDSTLDILTIMSDRVTVKFKVGPDLYETEKGRWCHLCKYVARIYKRLLYSLRCREDEQFTKLYGKRKALHKGGNSSCRFHIRQHYNVYKKKCDDAGIPVAHWAIPRDIWKAMEEAKEEAKRGRLTKKQTQQQLDFQSVTGPREFTRARTLDAITKLIATNNQVHLSAPHR